MKKIFIAFTAVILLAMSYLLISLFASPGISSKEALQLVSYFVATCCVTIIGYRALFLANLKVSDPVSISFIGLLFASLGVIKLL